MSQRVNDSKRKGGKIERTCVGCGAIKSKHELLRVARLKGGEVVVDVEQRQGGRGAYVCPAQECILAAQKKNRLAPVLKGSVKADIYQKLFEVIAFGESKESSSLRLG